jgi:hypothetical protein
VLLLLCAHQSAAVPMLAADHCHQPDRVHWLGSGAAQIVQCLMRDAVMRPNHCLNCVWAAASALTHCVTQRCSQSDCSEQQQWQQQQQQQQRQQRQQVLVVLYCVTASGLGAVSAEQ